MIDVAFTPADLREADVVVVVDVLRATTTAAHALAAGYQRVLCADSIEGALTLARPGRVLAGERGCVMPEGFDQGNSPLEAAVRHGEELVLTTTNGAPAIVAAAARAPTVILGALVNLDAVRAFLDAAGPWHDRDVQVLCSGTDGACALEDVYVAGRVCATLDGPRTDAALVAEAVARAHPDAFLALGASANAAVLVATGSADDITACAQESSLRVVPWVVATEAADAGAGGIATLADRCGSVPVTMDASDLDATELESPTASRAG